MLAEMTPSDLDLLRRFTCEHAQDAFTELVKRHVNLVYSAALRQIRSPQLAEEIAQSVFADLARNADKLKPDTVLTAWLYAVARRTAIDVIRKESRRQLREQIAIEMNAINATETTWTQIEPLLDEAVSALDETDRAAVLLRYFENQSFREVGRRLGVSDDTAQKRVSRAVEHLREFFASRGVAVGAGGLAAVISANAVQAAPAGLAATISAAAVLTGTAVQTSTLITATKTIAMTTLQKTLVTATIAALAGGGIYAARQAVQLHDQVQMLQQQQAPLAGQIQQLQRERDDATNRLAGLLAENSRLKANPHRTELLKLRGQVTTLRADATQRAQSDNSLAEMVKGPQMKEFMKTAMAGMVDKVYAKLFGDLHLTPEQASALKQLLIDKSTVGMESGAAMLSGKTTPAQLKEMGDKITAEKTGVEDQIKQLLGADGFAAYQAYDKSYLERAAVVGPASFTEQLAGGQELTPDQTEQLIQAMANERQNFKFTVDYTDKSKATMDMAAMYSDENMARYEQEQDRLNQLYVARAQSILSPEQLATFQKFLTSRTAMGMMSLKMGAKMLGAKAGGN